jgi:hypothetical protein
MPGVVFFTALAMAIIPEDVSDDIYILSKIELLDLTDIVPPDRCHPNALYTVFHSQLAFVDTHSIMEDRSMRANTLTAIALAQQASPS